MENQSKTAIIYCRVSSTDQLEGTSLESQERFCNEYAQKEGIKVLNTFIERGESAKTANRTEFTKAIAFCTDKKNQVDYFIVYKIDRFARNQEDHIMVRAVLKRAGTSLRSVTEPINETPVGRAMEGMVAVFAELDNNVRTERSKIGMVERLRQGAWVFPCPLGYYRPAHDNNIAPDPKNAAYIKIAFEEYSKGTHTFKSLANFLAERGFRTAQGKVPLPQLVEKILRNKLYCGIMEAFNQEFIGTFEPIINQELFMMCQKGYKRNHRVSNNPAFPLRKLIICDECKQSLTASYSKGRKGIRYAYYHHQTQGCPKATFIPKQTFEQLFVEYLNEITPDVKHEKLFKAIILDIWKSNYKKFNEENDRIRKELSSLEHERLTIFEMHRKGVYSDEDLLEQKQIISDRIKQKNLLIKHKQTEEFNMEEVLEYSFNFVKNTARIWEESEHEVRLRLQKNVFAAKLEFDGEKFGTTQLSSVYRLNKEVSQTKKTSSQKSTLLAAPRGIEPRLPG